MNSLNRYRPAKQFRCMPLLGDSPFRYVEIVRSQDGSHNYQPENGLVDAFFHLNEKGRDEWKSLTGSTEIGAETSSVSSATTGKSSKSYSDVKTMSMTVCSQLSNSATNSQGLKNDYQ